MGDIMNRKGFTLVEVLVVIAIVAILLLVLVPNVFVMIDKNNVKSCNSLIKNIESAAKIYVNENKYSLGFDCDNKISIKFQDLIGYGSLKTDDGGKIINPINDKEISLESVVDVTYNCNTREFIYDVNAKDINGEIIECK